jgi:hypothetical protein
MFFASFILTNPKQFFGGRETLSRAEAKLATFGDVDDAIVAYRSERIKAVAKGGPAADLTLPDDLLNRRAARDQALQEVAANKVAHNSLVADVSAAQKDFRRAEECVNEAANSILFEKARSQAAVLKAAWSNVWHLFDALGSFKPAGVSERLANDWSPTLQHH